MARKNKKSSKKKSKRIVGSIKHRFKSKLMPRDPLPTSMLDESDMDVPEGFRAVSMSQAIMEYAKPLRKLAEEGGISDLNEVLQMVMPLWNYTIDRGREAKQDEIRTTLIDSFKAIFGVDRQNAESLFVEMLERKTQLFPPELQPQYTMTMIMKKEIAHLIIPFNFNSLGLLNEIISPNGEDQQLVRSIQTMDQYIVEGTDYDYWESHYLKMEEDCSKRFRQWLFHKVGNKNSPDFAFCIEPFLNFIYRYEHSVSVVLATVSPAEIEEFLHYHLLRKVVVDPHEYVWWIPAIKLLYSFLHEKGYLSEPSPLVQHLDDAEPIFIEFLREQFS